MSKYNQQYCEKHNQPYADFLKKCPICRGEEIYEEKQKDLDKKNKE